MWRKLIKWETIRRNRSLQQLMNGHPSDELKEQILEFQAAFIHNIHRRRKTQISMHNPRHVQMLNAIWEAAGVADVQLPGARKWRKLGFSVSIKQ